MALDHIESGQWPVLLSSAAHDAERRAADLHADVCGPCTAARARSQNLLLLLQQLPQPPAPQASTLHRVLTGIDGALVVELGAQRRAVRLQIGAMVVGFVLLVAGARERVGGRTDWAMALSLLWIATMVPTAVRLWRKAGLLLLVLAVPFALWRVTGGGFELGHALPCVLGELMGAALPLVALAAVIRQTGVFVGPLAFAAAAAGGAMAGQAALLLTCPGGRLGHLLAFHVGTVALGAVLGALARRLPVMSRSAA